MATSHLLHALPLVLLLLAVGLVPESEAFAKKKKKQLGQHYARARQPTGSETGTGEPSDPFFEKDYPVDSSNPLSNLNLTDLGQDLSVDVGSEAGTSAAAANDPEAAEAEEGTSEPETEEPSSEAEDEAKAEEEEAKDSTEESADAVGGGTSSVEGCVTRADPRASSWVGQVAAPGAKCVFGVDDRDEGEHCVMDMDYGSYGWCWTDSAQSSWGSCDVGCPLSGHAKVLGKKIDKIKDTLGDVMEVLNETNTTSNVTNATSNASALPTEGAATADAAPAEPAKTEPAAKKAEAPPPAAKKEAAAAAAPPPEAGAGGSSLLHRRAGTRRMMTRAKRNA